MRTTGPRHPANSALQPASTPESWADTLRASLSIHTNIAHAVPMRAYMKDQFAFFGIKSPERISLTRGFIVEHGLPPVDEIETVVLRLWDAPERECHYAALDLMERSLKRLPADAMIWIEHLIVTKSWWDTVDQIASHLVGGLFQRYRDLQEPWIDRWRVADNIWLRRTALLFQLRYKTETDASLLFALVEENLASREFFIQKAIGWALREYAKTAPVAVSKFVNATPLASLSRREALKHLAAKSS